MIYHDADAPDPQTLPIYPVVVLVVYAAGPLFIAS